MTYSETRRCANHGTAPAIAVCTKCDRDICVACHGADARGYAVCEVCRSDHRQPLTPWADPESDYAPDTLLRTVWDALRHPINFFDLVRPTPDRWVAASIFGMLCTGVGLVFSKLWTVLFLADATQMAEVAEQAGVSPVSLQTLTFVSIPFLVVLGFAVQVALFHAAIKIAGGSFHMKTTAKVVGYSSAGFLLMLIPPIGTFALGQFLAIIWLFNLRANALQKWEDMNPWKAMFVVAVPLLPSMIFMV